MLNLEFRDTHTVRLSESRVITINIIILIVIVRIKLYHNVKPNVYFIFLNYKHNVEYMHILALIIDLLRAVSSYL